ncbi:MAG TPA: hypothetical protein VGU23_08385 [Acidobacteriaceae bacterium]|jgi:hypothetical protein|nr:hypothetical protein [Acidobacteriaceae bacterium]
MTTLTTNQSAHILRTLLQFVQKDLEANPQFSMMNLTTLMLVIEHTSRGARGESDPLTQPEVGLALGFHPTKDAATLSRQLRYLRGKRQGVVQSPLLPVVQLEPKESDNRVNTVSLTDDGEKFASNLARLFNKLLKQATNT